MSKIASVIGNFSIKVKLVAAFSVIMVIMMIISGMSYLKSADFADIAELSKYMIEKEVDHLYWASDIKRLFVQNTEQLEVQTDPHKCDLGLWYYTFLESSEFKNLPDDLRKKLLDIEQPHAELHATAVRIGDEYKQIHYGLESTLRRNLDTQREWAERVSVQLIQNEQITQQTDPEKCSLGVWIEDDECQKIMGTWPEFAKLIHALEPSHRAMHESVHLINKANTKSKKNLAYTTTTLPQLSILAGYFDQLIELEVENEKGQAAAREIMVTETEPKLKEVLKGIIVATNGLDDEAKSAQKAMVSTIVIGLLAGVIFTVILVFVLSGGIVGPTMKLMTAMEHLGNNDLTAKVDIDSEDEIGRMAKIFNATTTKLREVITTISDSSKEVAAAGNQISTASEEMATGAEEQQAQLSEVATSIEEMSAMILETSNNAEQTQGSAGDANLASEEGQTVVENTIHGIEGITTIVNAASEQITALKHRSEEIGEVIQVIDDIADQTNLLALNANIEAARAGDAGRGFAVVADEVRKLAERTVKATGDIGEKINLIQVDVNSAVDAMGKITTQSADGQKTASEAGNALQKISESIGNVNASISQIASAAVEQSAGVEEISKNVETVSTVSKQSASGAQELASSSEQLNREVQALDKQITQFKI